MDNTKIKMACVCLKHGKDCERSGYVADVKGKSHLFCCEKGFEQSLVDFLEHLKPRT